MDSSVVRVEIKKAIVDIGLDEQETICVIEALNELN